MNILSTVCGFWVNEVSKARLIVWWFRKLHIGYALNENICAFSVL